jgi:hypothetical protein
MKSDPKESPAKKAKVDQKEAKAPTKKKRKKGE